MFSKFAPIAYLCACDFNFKNNPWLKYQQLKCLKGCIFSHVQPFYEQAVSDLDP
jgi:hypothetical protein